VVASAPKGERSKDYSSSRKVPLKNHSEQVNFEPEHLLHGLPALKSRQNTRHLRLRAGSPSTGCVGRELTNGSEGFARWKVMESSISLSCDTCYSEFDLG